MDPAPADPPATGAETPTQRPRRGCCSLRVLLLTPVLLILVLLAAAALLLYLGVPQRAALNQAARAIGADIALGTLRTTHTGITLASLTLHDPNHRDAPPLADLRGLRIAYTLFPFEQAGLRAIAIDSLALWIDGSDPANTNYTFLERLLPETQPHEPDTPRAPALPRDTRIVRDLAIHLGAFSATIHQPDYRIEAGPIEAAVRVGPDRPSEAWITGRPALRIEQDGERIAIPEAPLELRLTIMPESIQLVAKAQARPWADVDARAAFHWQPAGWDGTIDIASAHIEALPEPLRAWLPLDTTFDRIHIAPSTIAFGPTDAGTALAPSTLAATAEGLWLGPADAPWFRGDLQVDLVGAGDTVHGQLTHDGARTLYLDATLGDDPALALELSDWTYPDLEALTPFPYLDTVALASALHRLDGTLTLRLDDGTLFAGAALTPAFGLDPAWHDALAITAEAAYTLDDATAVASGTLTLRDNAMQIALTRDSDGGTTVDATMEAFDLPRLAQVLALAPPAVRDLDSRFSGTAALRLAGDDATIRLALAASPPPFLPFETLKGQSLALAADLTAGAGFSPLRGRAQLTFANDAALEATGIRLAWNPLDGAVTLTGTADLGALAAYLDLGPLAGDLAATVPMRIGPTTIETDLDIAIDGATYGGIGLPYGALMTLTGTATYATEDGTGTLRNATLGVGHGTHITAPRAAFTTQPPTLDAPDLALHSDGITLVGLGWLDRVDGTVAATGSLTYTPADYHLALTYETAYDLLTLRNALAVIAGGTGTGHFTLTPATGMAGEGLLAADELAVFGVTLDTVRMPLTFDGDALLIREFEAGLYNGRVLTNGRIGLLEDGLPIALRARLRSVDFAPFSDAFLSPETHITGIVNGTIAIETHNYAITAFEATLRSARDFSINRNLLAQLILSEQVGESAGRAVTGVLEEVLGERTQRPFDGAEIDLALQGDRIRGLARLFSPTLNLTIDLTLDPRHVAELIQLNQRQQLDRLRTP